MKNLIKMKALSVILAMLLIFLAVPARVSAASQQPVDLGSASTFAVLAGETVTNTGATTISGSLPEGGGNVGVYPGTTFPG